MTKEFNGNVLALDIASVMGWSMGRPGKVPTFGNHRLLNHGQPRARAYRSFRLWLDLFMSAHKVDLIVYESPALPMIMQGKTNIDTIKVLTGLAEHLEEWAYERVELREASVAQVRAHFLGRNMKSAVAKPLTITRCKELGWPVTNSDEADACALWDYQISWLRPDQAVKTTPLFQRA
jgi:hypothetical protein